MIVPECDIVPGVADHLRAVNLKQIVGVANDSLQRSVDHQHVVFACGVRFDLQRRYMRNRPVTQAEDRRVQVLEWNLHVFAVCNVNVRQVREQVQDAPSVGGTPVES